MKTKQAIETRSVQFCQERSTSVNAIANESGIPPSTLYSILNEKSQTPGIVSLKMLCDGFGITLRQFFDDPIFDDLEQEIQ